MVHFCDHIFGEAKDIEYIAVKIHLMRKSFLVVFLILCFEDLKSQSIIFDSPDTICLNEKLNIQNLSTNIQSSLWSFCKGNDEIYKNSFFNLGNLTGDFNIVNNHDIVFDGVNYIQIITNYNNSPNNVYLANYGNNVENNTPQLKNLYPFLSLANGRRPTAIQIEHDDNAWFCFILYDGAQPRFLRLNFGNSLLNNPIVDDLGSFGILDFLSYDFELVKDGNGDFHGFFSGISNNGIRHLNFGNSLSNTPVHNNLGTFGIIGDMCTIKFKLIDNNWMAIISNTGNSLTKPNTIFKFNFGADLNNTNPTIFELGDFGTDWPHVALFFQECGIPKLYFVDGLGNDLFEMTFPNGYLEDNFIVRNLGNVGNFNQTGQFSEFFVAAPNRKVSFWAGGYNNSIIRQSFSICNTAGIPNSYAYQPNPIQFQETGVYQIIYTANFGTLTESSFCKEVVVISPSISLNLGNDTTYCGNFSRVLMTGNPSTTWSTGQTSASITVTQPGVYWAEISDECGVVRDSILISNDDCGCDKLFIPNSFSPNNDNINDVYKPLTDCLVENLRFMIFNRWGEKVFETSNILIGWDGTFKGLPAPLDSFAWYLEYNFVGEEKKYQQKGMVTLIR